MHLDTILSKRVGFLNPGKKRAHQCYSNIFFPLPIYNCALYLPKQKSIIFLSQITVKHVVFSEIGFHSPCFIVFILPDSWNIFVQCFLKKFIVAWNRHILNICPICNCEGEVAWNRKNHRTDCNQMENNVSC